MSKARITLEDFLGLNEIDLTPDRVPELMASDAYTQVKAELEKQAGPVWQIVRTQIPGHLTKLLDIDGVAVLVGAWNKARGAAQVPRPRQVSARGCGGGAVDEAQGRIEASPLPRPLGRRASGRPVALRRRSRPDPGRRGVDDSGWQDQEGQAGKALAVGTLKCEGAVLHSIDKKLTSLPGVSTSARASSSRPETVRAEKEWYSLVLSSMNEEVYFTDANGATRTPTTRSFASSATTRRESSSRRSSRTWRCCAPTAPRGPSRRLRRCGR